MGKHKHSKSLEKGFENPNSENQSVTTAIYEIIKKILADFRKSNKAHGKRAKHHNTSEIIALVLAICLLLAFVVILRLMWS